MRKMTQCLSLSLMMLCLLFSAQASATDIDPDVQPDPMLEAREAYMQALMDKSRVMSAGVLDDAALAPQNEAITAARKAFLGALREGAIAEQEGELTEDQRKNLEEYQRNYEQKLDLFEASLETTSRVAAEVNLNYTDFLERRYSDEYERKTKAEQSRLEPSLSSLTSGTVAVLAALVALAGYAFLSTRKQAKTIQHLQSMLEDKGALEEA